MKLLFTRKLYVSEVYVCSFECCVGDKNLLSCLVILHPLSLCLNFVCQLKLSPLLSICVHRLHVEKSRANGRLCLCNVCSLSLTPVCVWCVWLNKLFLCLVDACYSTVRAVLPNVNIFLRYVLRLDIVIMCGMAAWLTNAWSLVSA